MRRRSLLGVVLAALVSSAPAFAVIPTPFNVTTDYLDARSSSHSSSHAAYSGSSMRSPSFSFHSSPAPSSSMRAAPSISSPPSSSMRAPSGSSPSSSMRAVPPPSTSGNSATSNMRSGSPAQAQRAAPPPLPQSRVDQNIARGQSANALAAFKATQPSAPKPAIGAPQTRQQATASPVWNRYGSSWHSSDQYFASRSAAIGRLPPASQAYWSHPPAVIIVRPSYGGYSSAFYGALLGYGVASMIDNSYYNWAYAHRYDPAYEQWHSDMVAQAQNDAEVKAKLDALDAKMTEMQTNGVQANANVPLPTGVDPSMAVAPDTAMMATAAPDSGLGWLAWTGIVLGVLIVIGVGYAMFGRKSAIA